MHSPTLRSPTVPNEVQVLRYKSDKHEQVISEAQRQLADAVSFADRAAEASMQTSRIRYGGTMQSLKEAQVTVEGQLGAMGPTVTHSLLQVIADAQQNCDEFRNVFSDAITVASNTNEKRDALIAAQREALDSYSKRTKYLETELRSFVLSTRHLSDVLFHVRKYAMVVMQERAVWQQRLGLNPADQIPEEEAAAFASTDTFLGKCERLLEDLEKGEMPRLVGQDTMLASSSTAPAQAPSASIDLALSSSKTTRTVTPVSGASFPHNQRTSQTQGREGSLDTLADDDEDALFTTNRSFGASPTTLGNTQIQNRSTSSRQSTRLHQFLPSSTAVGVTPPVAGGKELSPSFMVGNDSNAFTSPLRSNPSMGQEAHEAMQNTLGSRRIDSMRLITLSSGSGGEILDNRMQSFSMSQKAMHIASQSNLGNFRTSSASSASPLNAAGTQGASKAVSGVDAFASTTNRLIGEIRTAKRALSPSSGGKGPNGSPPNSASNSSPYQSTSSPRAFGITFVPPSVQPSYANPPNINADTIDTVVGNFVKRTEILRTRDREVANELSYGATYQVDVGGKRLATGAQLALPADMDTVRCGERTWRIKGGAPLRWVKPKEELALLKVMLASSSGNDVASLLEALRNAHESNSNLKVEIKSVLAIKCRGLREELAAMRRDLNSLKLVVIPNFTKQLQADVVQHFQKAIPKLVEEELVMVGNQAQRAQKAAIELAVANALRVEREQRQEEQRRDSSNLTRGKVLPMPLDSAVFEQNSSYRASVVGSSVLKNSTTSSPHVSVDHAPTSPLAAARDQFLDQQRQRQDGQQQAMLQKQQQLLELKQQAVEREHQLLRQQRKQLEEKLKFIMPMKKKKSVKPDDEEGTLANADPDYNADIFEEGEEVKRHEPTKVDTSQLAPRSDDEAGDDKGTADPLANEEIGPFVGNACDQQTNPKPSDEGGMSHQREEVPNGTSLETIGKGLLALFGEVEAETKSSAVPEFRGEKRVSLFNANSADAEERPSPPTKVVELTVDGRRFLIYQCDSGIEENVQGYISTQSTAANCDINGPLIAQKEITGRKSLFDKKTSDKNANRPWAAPFFNVSIATNAKKREKPQPLSVDGLGHDPQGNLLNASRDHRSLDRKLAFPSNVHSNSPIALSPAPPAKPIIPLADQWRKQEAIDRKINEALLLTERLGKATEGQLRDEALFTSNVSMPRSDRTLLTPSQMPADEGYNIRTLEVLNANGESASAIHKPFGTSFLQNREAINLRYSPQRSYSLQQYPTLTSPTEPVHYTESVDFISPRPPHNNDKKVRSTNRHPLLLEQQEEKSKARLRHLEKPKY